MGFVLTVFIRKHFFLLPETIVLEKLRDKRSGGFPKFPIAVGINERSDPQMCGRRTVEHKPMLATYKIVGGSIPPYGAYPWQVKIKLEGEEGGKGLNTIN